MTTGPPVTTQVYGDPAVTARPVTTTGYDTFGDTAETEDPDGNVTTYGYDADGRQVSETLPALHAAGRFLGDHRRSTPRPTTTTATSSPPPTGSNNTTTYGYDQQGNQVTETTPTTASPPPPTTPTGSRCRSLTPPGRGHRVHLRLPGPGGDLDAGRAVLRRRDRRLHHQLLLQRRTGGMAVAGDHPGQRDHPVLLRPGRGEDRQHQRRRGHHLVLLQLARRADRGHQPRRHATATGYDGAGNVTSTTNLDASGNTLATTSATFDGEGDQLSSTDAEGNGDHVHLRPDRDGHPGSPAGLRHQRHHHLVRLRRGRKPDPVHRRQRQPVVGHLQQLGAAAVPRRAVHRRLHAPRRTRRSPSPTTPTRTRSPRPSPAGSRSPAPTTTSAS